MSAPRTIDLQEASDAQREAMARILVDAFAELAPDAWPTIESARSEVDEALEPDRVGRYAVGDGGEALGWIGAIPAYGGNVWELHPLAVRPDRQGEGIGTALVGEIERIVADRGGLTLWVGADDETDRTTLSGIDLYPDPLAKLADLRAVRPHPVTFYRKLGFEVVGVMPEANGFGKPDLFLARRVAGPIS